MNQIKTEVNFFMVLISGVHLTEDEIELFEKNLAAYAQSLVSMVPTATTECLFESTILDSEKD